MKIFAKKVNPLVSVLLEYEKLIMRLKAHINDLEDQHLKLLQEYRSYRESMDSKLMALTRPDAVATLRGPRAKGTMEAKPPRPDDLPVTKERLEELFNER